jgi:hypothetical protein
MSTEPVKREYFSGLDLGQLQEPTALVVAERTRSAGEKEYRYAVRHIHRWHLGTGYPEIVADVKKMFAVPPLTRSMLAIDRTGVGKAVTNQFTEAGIPAQVQPYLITAGHTPATYTVPKVDLVGVLQTLRDAALEDRRQPSIGRGAYEGIGTLPHEGHARQGRIVCELAGTSSRRHRAVAGAGVLVWPEAPGVDHLNSHYLEP